MNMNLLASLCFLSALGAWSAADLTAVRDETSLLQVGAEVKVHQGTQQTADSQEEIDDLDNLRFVELEQEAEAERDEANEIEFSFGGEDDSEAEEELESEEDSDWNSDDAAPAPKKAAKPAAKPAAKKAATKPAAKKGAKKGGAPRKSKLCLTLLEFFLITGLCGVDRCYMGDCCLGVVKALTLGGLGVWVLLDWFVVVINCVNKKTSIDSIGFTANFGKDNIDSSFYLACVMIGLMACKFCCGATVCCFSTHKSQPANEGKPAPAKTY